MSSEKYSKGPCVLGEKCKCPHMELRPEHTCPACNQIVHVLCGKFCKTRDKCVCGCVSNKTVAVKEININAGEQMAMVSTITQSTTASEITSRRYRAIISFARTRRLINNQN